MDLFHDSYNSRNIFRKLKINRIYLAEYSIKIRSVESLKLITIDFFIWREEDVIRGWLQIRHNINLSSSSWCLIIER